MPKWFFLLCFLAFLGSFTSGKSVLSQPAEPGLAEKPVQCGAIYDVLNEMQEMGMETFFGGLGSAISVNVDKPIPVYVYLAINMETQQWAVLEVGYDQTDACIIGFGVGANFDHRQLKEFTNPHRYQ